MWEVVGWRGTGRNSMRRCPKLEDELVAKEQQSRPKMDRGCLLCLWYLRALLLARSFSLLLHLIE